MIFFGYSWSVYYILPVFEPATPHKWSEHLTTKLPSRGASKFVVATLLYPGYEEVVSPLTFMILCSFYISPLFEISEQIYTD